MNFLRRKWHNIPIAVISAILAIVLLAGSVYAITYNLNKTIGATVTITAPEPEPTEVTLYTDALCSTPIPVGYIHNFGTVLQGGTPQNPLWFKAAEINPATIAIATTGLPGDAQVAFFVGTPMGGQPGQPCTIAMWLPSDLPAGTYDFSFTVTGTN